MGPLSVTLRDVSAVLDGAGIRYAVGGSLASSAHGICRSASNIDMVAAIAPAEVAAFVAALGSEWYADLREIRTALGSGQSFQVIHIKTAHRVAIFPAVDEFHRRELDRAIALPLADDQSACVVTAEDILLAKLQWYRDGRRIQEVQWNDITGLIATSVTVDWEYVNEWAGRLGVAGLLEKARADVAE